MGKLFMKVDLENDSKGPVVHFGAMVAYYPICARDQSRLHQFGKKVLPGIFLGCALFTWEFGMEMLWSQTLRNWKTWTRQKSILEECQRSI